VQDAQKNAEFDVAHLAGLSLPGERSLSVFAGNVNCPPSQSTSTSSILMFRVRHAGNCDFKVWPAVLWHESHETVRGITSAYTFGGPPPDGTGTDRTGERRFNAIHATTRPGQT